MADGKISTWLSRLSDYWQHFQIAGNIVRWLATFADGHQHFQMASTIGK